MSLDLDLKWHPPLEHPFRGDPTPVAFDLELACTLDQPVTGVFGPSGAGKSTLLALVAGLLRPRRGRIALGQTALFDDRSSLDVPTHRRRVSVVFQDGRLFPHLNVLHNLRYGYAGQVADAEFQRTVDSLALAPLLHRDVRRLSGGERQRVALGRALLTHPRLLLLDEPLASLDIAMKRQLLPMLRGVAETSGVPMLYVSHDVGEILQLTHELLVLEAGRRVAQGPLHQVVRDPHVFQLAARMGLENIVRVRVEEHLPESGLTRLLVVSADSPSMGAVLLGPPVNRTAGSILTVAIRPEDVAIALDNVSGVSIQNQIPGKVIRAGDVAGRGLLEVDVGENLLVEISLRSMSSLGLVPGRPVHCLFKAHAIRYLDA